MNFEIHSIFENKEFDVWRECKGLSITEKYAHLQHVHKGNYIEHIKEK